MCIGAYRRKPIVLPLLLPIKSACVSLAKESVGLAGLSSEVGFDGELLVGTLLLLRQLKLKLILSMGRAFASPSKSTSTTTTKTTPYPKGLGLDSPWVLSGAAVLVGC